MRASHVHNGALVIQPPPLRRFRLQCLQLTRLRVDDLLQLQRYEFLRARTTQGSVA